MSLVRGWNSHKAAIALLIPHTPINTHTHTDNRAEGVCEPTCYREREREREREKEGAREGERESFDEENNFHCTISAFLLLTSDANEPGRAAELTTPPLIWTEGGKESLP